jgi:hypothetical protein
MRRTKVFLAYYVIAGSLTLLLYLQQPLGFGSSGSSSSSIAYVGIIALNA